MSDLSVLNVYETAADIGREVENVIDEFGSEAMCNLMPNIIRVLEQLEALVTQKEQDRARIERLEEEIVTFAKDGVRKNEDNLKLQMEIRQLEELIRNEEVDLMNVADKIQRENRQLKEELSEKQKLNVSDMVQEQETIKVLNQLKETVDRQRDDIRVKDADLRAKTEEVEALQQQVERMFKVNSNFHRKNQHQEEIAKKLIHEKSQLQSELAAMKQEAVPVVHVHAGRSSNRDVQDGKEEDVARMKSKEVATNSSQSEAVQVEDEKPSNMQSVNLEGKMIIDMKDPNRPRFTLKEMAHVLEERDNMKMQVMEMEDELEVYKPKETTLLLTPAQQRLRADSTQKRDRSDSGIKRFFGNFLKKLSPQKKTAPGYNEGVWEVFDPTEVKAIKSSDLFREEEMNSPLGSSPLGDVIVEEEEGDVEEVRLQVFLGEPITSLPDGTLNRSLDTNHFAGLMGESRSRGNSAGANDSNGMKEEVDETKDKAGVVEAQRTNGSVEAAVPIGCLIGTGETDINGNTNGCVAAAAGGSPPTMAETSETKSQTSKKHPGEGDGRDKHAS